MTLDLQVLRSHRCSACVDTDMVEEAGHDLGVGVVEYGRMSDELESKVAQLPNPRGLVLLSFVPV